MLKNVAIHLPIDSIIADQFAAHAHTTVVDSNAIKEGWMGLDIGPQACRQFADIIKKSKTILWNGPMGVFEMPTFAGGTFAVAQAVANLTGYTVVGGGDSVSAIHQSGLASKIRHISTGGGASLEFLEGLELPGVAALQSVSETH